MIFVGPVELGIAFLVTLITYFAFRDRVPVVVRILLIVVLFLITGIFVAVLVANALYAIFGN